jgi:xanthine dehydrogenase iron-sulfur cluster and FAD-binding subunit A
MMMRAQALLQKNPPTTDAEIRAWLEPNLCRCGTHMRILRAVRRAASTMRASSTSAGCRSAGRSSMHMRVGCGQRQMNLAAPYFSSLSELVKPDR